MPAASRVVDCNLKWLLKEEGGYIFDSCSQNTPTTYAVSLALFMYTWRDSVMLLCHALAYAITANGVSVFIC